MLYAVSQHHLMKDFTTRHSNHALERLIRLNCTFQVSLRVIHSRLGPWSHIGNLRGIWVVESWRRNWPWAVEELATGFLRDATRRTEFSRCGSSG